MSFQFRNAAGRFFTRDLFLETAPGGSGSLNPVYTLKREDHTLNGKTYYSLYLRYLETNDPTEYKFAKEHLGGWAHWKELSSCNWFQEYLEEWREELEVRIRSEALNRIVKETKTNSRESFQANKYLLDKGWSEKKSDRGRPKNEDIKKRVKEMAEEQYNLNEDAQRLGLSVN